MTPEKFYQLYRDKFVAIYADYVALTQTKPEQILIEESNVLSHIAQFNNPELDPKLQQENLDKAGNHIIRATIDLHKLTWVYLAKELFDNIIRSEEKRLCFNMPENDVLAKHSEFIQKSLEARRLEMKSIGNDPLKAIEIYQEVTDLGMSLIDKLDEMKVRRLNKLSAFIRTKEFIWGVVTGTVGSILAYGIVEFLVHIFSSSQIAP